MGAVATMIVRIGANVDDLVKGMDKATKEVAKASKQIAELGKELTLFVTAPVAIAGFEFAKLAAEADALGDRLERVFGDQTQDMTTFLKNLQDTVPESTMSLDKMAISLQNLTLNMGGTRDQATAMTKNLLELAADAAAFHGGSMEDALQALERGLAGKGRGLIEYGIVMKNTDIQQEAFRLHLLNLGKTLTPLGTAIASMSLMQKGSTRIMGEAARVAGEEETKMKFLKARFVDMAVHMGTVLLPAFGGLLDVLNGIATALGKVNPKIIEFVAVSAGIAAIIGPVLGLIAGIGKLIVLIRGLSGAFAAIRAASGIGAILSAIAAPEIIAAIAVLAAVITGLVMLWKALHKEADKPLKGADKLKNAMGSAGLGGGATSFDPEKFKTPFEQLEQSSKLVASEFEYAKSRGESILQFYDQAAQAQIRLTRYAQTGADDVKTKAIAAIRALQPLLDEKKLASMGLGQSSGQIAGLPASEVASRFSNLGDRLSGAFENAVKQGGALQPIFDQTFTAAESLETIIDGLPDKTDDWAVALQSAYEKLRPLMMAAEMMGMAAGSGTQRGDSSGHAFNAKAAAAKQFGTDTQDYQNLLKVRLEMLKLPHIFNALGEAMVREGERHRQVSDELALAKTQFRSLRVVIQGFEDAITAGMAELLNMISSASIGQHIMDKIEGKVSNFIDGAIDKTFGYVTNAIGSLFGRGKHRTGHNDPFQTWVEGMQYASTRLASSAGLRQLEATIKLQLTHNLTIEKRIALEARLTQIQQALGEAMTETIGVLNQPSGLKLALLRFNSTIPTVGTRPVLPGGSAQPAGTGGNVTHINGPVTVQVGNRSLREVLSELGTMQQQSNKRGGAPSFQTALRGA